MPPVSINSKGRPSCSAVPYMRSRVIPDSSPTMARRCPVMRLKRVDFPTLGLPTMTTVGMASDMKLHDSSVFAAAMLSPDPSLPSSVVAMEPGAIDRASALRILETIARYGTTGTGDVELMHGEWQGCYRLRIGDGVHAWRWKPREGRISLMRYNGPSRCRYSRPGSTS